MNSVSIFSGALQREYDRGYMAGYQAAIDRLAEVLEGETGEVGLRIATKMVYGTLGGER